MTILFAGGEMGAFTPADSSALESTAAGTFNSSFSRCSLAANASGSYLDSAQFTAFTDGWVHANIFARNFTSSGTEVPLILLDGSDTETIRLLYDRLNTTLAVQYWNGTAWTTAGSSFTIDLHANDTDIDLHAVVNSASGSLTLYVAGSQRVDASVDLSGIASIEKVRHEGHTGAAYPNISQVIVADESTIGWRLTTVPPTGAGASTSWTGTFAEVDEAVYSDADFINSDTADEIELFAHSTTIPTGYAVRGVVVTARAKCGTSGPQNMRHVLRSSGTTYDNGSDLALDAGYGAFVSIWETDPATSADFTTSAITALQFGVKSIT